MVCEAGLGNYSQVHPRVLIVAGNFVVSSIPDLWLDNMEVAVAVMEEWGVTFVEWLRVIEAGMFLRGIEGRSVRGLDLAVRMVDCEFDRHKGD